jgi:hypothetical protein
MVDLAEREEIITANMEFNLTLVPEFFCQFDTVLFAHARFCGIRRAECGDVANPRG